MWHRRDLWITNNIIKRIKAMIISEKFRIRIFSKKKSVNFKNCTFGVLEIGHIYV